MGITNETGGRGKSLAEIGRQPDNQKKPPRIDDIQASSGMEQRMEAPRDEIDEAGLIQSAAGGDAEAFTELFNRYYAMIHAFAYRLTLCGSDAGDVAQETFIKAARALPGFRRESSFKNWLYRIALNAAEDLRRRNARHSRLAGELASAAARSSIRGIIRAWRRRLPPWRVICGRRSCWSIMKG